MSLKNIKKWLGTLTENNKTYLDSFIYKAIKLLVTKDYSTAYTYIKGELCSNMLSLFGKTLNTKVNAFMQNGYVQIVDTITLNKPTNDANSVNIQIESVHSVKGMTHCATLYVETAYEGKYESTYCVMEKKNK